MEDESLGDGMGRRVQRPEDGFEDDGDLDDLDMDDLPSLGEDDDNLGIGELDDVIK